MITTVLMYLGGLIVAMQIWVGVGAVLTLFLLDRRRGPWPNNLLEMILVWFFWPWFLVRRVAFNLYDVLTGRGRWA